MANISYNRIHETFDAATLAEALNKVKDVTNILPKGSLTPEQRKQYQGLDVRNLSFVEDAVRVKNGFGGALLPPIINNDTLDVDVALYKQISILRYHVNNLATMLTDVERIVAHEAYGAALLHYKYYKAAEKAGGPNAREAVEQLDWRFKKQGAKANKKGGPKES